MEEEFRLSSKDSSRVTYAAVFIPSADNPDQETKYLLPKGIRGASGFDEYDRAKHHRDTGLGTMCCGNCFEQGQQVPIHHRKPTDERVGGGDKEGTQATFVAYPNTIQDHVQDCKDRRTSTGRSAQSQSIRWNVNIPETYQGETAPGLINPADPLLAKRTSKVIHTSIGEILAPASRLTREQVQDSVYVVGGHVTKHADMMVDGDSWKKLVLTRNADVSGLYKIFHVTKNSAGALRDFFAGAAAIQEIRCAQLTFTDQAGETHIINPVIKTSNPDVLAMLEKGGDLMLLAHADHTHFRTKTGIHINQVTIQVDSPGQVAELYHDPQRKISDFNAVHNLRLTADEVHVIDPKKRAAPARKVREADPAQTNLFGDTASVMNAAPH